MNFREQLDRIQRITNVANAMTGAKAKIEWRRHAGAWPNFRRVDARKVLTEAAKLHRGGAWFLRISDPRGCELSECWFFRPANLSN